MAYGIGSKERAQEKAALLAIQEPENKFEVMPHSWKPGFFTSVGGKVNEEAAHSWGVVRWTPYCEAVPFRNTGFVWFD